MSTLHTVLVFLSLLWPRELNDQKEAIVFSIFIGNFIIGPCGFILFLYNICCVYTSWFNIFSGSSERRHLCLKMCSSIRAVVTSVHYILRNLNSNKRMKYVTLVKELMKLDSAGGGVRDRQSPRSHSRSRSSSGRSKTYSLFFETP